MNGVGGNVTTSFEPSSYTVDLLERKSYYLFMQDKRANENFWSAISKVSKLYPHLSFQITGREISESEEAYPLIEVNTLAVKICTFANKNRCLRSSQSKNKYVNFLIFNVSSFPYPKDENEIINDIKNIIKKFLPGNCI